MEARLLSFEMLPAQTDTHLEELPPDCISSRYLTCFLGKALQAFSSEIGDWTLVGLLLQATPCYLWLGISTSHSE